MNQSQLTPEQQRYEFLARKAALFIHKYKTGEMTRIAIDRLVMMLDPSEQQTFKDLLNKYRLANNG